MKDDPIVREVRRIRDAHAAKFDYDLDAIYADLKEREAARDPRRSPLVQPLEGREGRDELAPSRIRFGTAHSSAATAKS